MQLNKLAIMLLGATATIATLPIGKRHAAEFVRRFDSGVEVSKRAPFLGERQNNGNNGGGCIGSE